MFSSSFRKISKIRYMSVSSLRSVRQARRNDNQAPPSVHYQNISPCVTRSDFGSFVFNHFSPRVAQALEYSVFKKFGQDTRMTDVQSELLPRLLKARVAKFDDTILHRSQDGLPKGRPLTSDDSSGGTRCNNNTDMKITNEHRPVDVFLQGRTGSGKTLIFLLKAFQVAEGLKHSGASNSYT